MQAWFHVQLDQKILDGLYCTCHYLKKYFWILWWNKQGMYLFEKVLKKYNALSIYKFKMILDHPNCFWRVQIVLVWSNSFWLGPNDFRLFWANFICNMDLSKIIWTQQKQIGPFQNYWYLTKIIWTVQNHFGPIEGQGITCP